MAFTSMTSDTLCFRRTAFDNPGLFRFLLLLIY